MLGGEGIYRGNTMLITGTAGTGKTSVAAHFIDAACRRGERALMFLFEESPAQFQRNMRSIGLDFSRWTRKGLLTFHAVRPTTFGLEMHLSQMVRLVDEIRPAVVVCDPITNLSTVAIRTDVRSMLMRFIDLLKSRGITAFFTALSDRGADEATDIGVSSVVDVWVLVRDVESNGERNRTLLIIKARGLGHSNQVREFLLTEEGVRLIEPYIGAAGVLTGSARVAQESRDRAEKESLQHQIALRRRLLAEKQRAVSAQISDLRSSLAAEEESIETLIAGDTQIIGSLDAGREAMLRIRGGAARDGK